MLFLLFICGEIVCPFRIGSFDWKCARSTVMLAVGLGRRQRNDGSRGNGWWEHALTGAHTAGNVHKTAIAIGFCHLWWLVICAVKSNVAGGAIWPDDQEVINANDHLRSMIRLAGVVHSNNRCVRVMIVMFSRFNDWLWRFIAGIALHWIAGWMELIWCMETISCGRVAWSSESII